MTKATINRRTALLGSMLLGSSLPAWANTSNWPNRTIRLIVAGSPGAAGDTIARLLAAPLSEVLKQSVVVEPRPGANGIIAVDAAAKANPDGYTFLFAPTSSILLNPVIHAKLPYNAEKDLTPVVQVGASGSLLVASVGSGFKNLADMVAYAKANPGKLAYGSWGTGSTGHLVMEGIKAHFGLDMPHAPYKTMATQISDLMGNNIQVGFTDVATPVPHINSGRLVGLGQSGSQRWPATQAIPTLSEQGFKFEADGWYGVFAPAGTPKEIVDRINAEIDRLQNSDDVRKQLEGQNMIAPPKRSAEEFAASLKKDTAIWQDLANRADLKTK